MNWFEQRRFIGIAIFFCIAIIASAGAVYYFKFRRESQNSPDASDRTPTPTGKPSPELEALIGKYPDIFLTKDLRLDLVSPENLKGLIEFSSLSDDKSTKRTALENLPLDPNIIDEVFALSKKLSDNFTIGEIENAIQSIKDHYYSDKTLEKIVIDLNLKNVFDPETTKLIENPEKYEADLIKLQEDMKESFRMAGQFELFRPNQITNLEKRYFDLKKHCPYSFMFLMDEANSLADRIAFFMDLSCMNKAPPDFKWVHVKNQLTLNYFLKTVQSNHPKAFDDEKLRNLLGFNIYEKLAQNLNLSCAQGDETFVKSFSDYIQGKIPWDLLNYNYQLAAVACKDNKGIKEGSQTFKDYYSKKLKDLLAQGTANRISKFNIEFEALLNDENPKKSEFIRLSNESSRIQREISNKMASKPRYLNGNLYTVVYNNIDPRNVKNIPDLEERKKKAKEMFRFIRLIRVLDPESTKSYPNVLAFWDDTTDTVKLEEDEVVEFPGDNYYTLEQCQKADEYFFTKLDAFYRSLDKQGDRFSLNDLVKYHRKVVLRCFDKTNLKPFLDEPVTYKNLYPPTGPLPEQYFISQYQLDLSEYLSEIERTISLVVENDQLANLRSKNLKIDNYLFPSQFFRKGGSMINRDIYYFYKSQFYFTLSELYKREANVSEPDPDEKNNLQQKLSRFFTLAQKTWRWFDNDLLFPITDKSSLNFNTFPYLTILPGSFPKGETPKIPKTKPIVTDCIPSLPSDIVKPLFYFMDQDFTTVVKGFLFSTAEITPSQVMVAFEKAKERYSTLKLYFDTTKDLAGMPIPFALLFRLIESHLLEKSKNTWNLLSDGSLKADNLSNEVISYAKTLTDKCAKITNLSDPDRPLFTREVRLRAFRAFKRQIWNIFRKLNLWKTWEGRIKSVENEEMNLFFCFAKAYSGGEFEDDDLKGNTSFNDYIDRLRDMKLGKIQPPFNPNQ